jgi:predicted  nucleic acid-binding Zn-ribbon protein
VTNVSISPDGVLVASGDRNGHIYVWEIESGQKLYTMMHHKKAITALSWRADSNLLAASSEDGEVSTWNIINGRKVKNFKAHGDGTTDVFYSNKGHLVTCGRDQHAKVYDGNYKQIKAIKLKSKLPLKAVATSEVQEVLYSDWRGQIHKWDLKTNKIHGITRSNPDSIPDQIIAFKTAIDNTLKETASLEKKIAQQQQGINYYNTLKQKPNKIRNDIKRINSEIKKLGDQLKAEKDKAKRDSLAKSIAAKKKAIPQLSKSIKPAEQEIQKRKKNVQTHYKVKAEAEQELKRLKAYIEILKVRIVRYEAEKVNSQRHKILEEISKLKIDIENSKYSIEDLKLQIKNNHQTITQLTALEDKIEVEMSEDEALNTLVKRYQKIQQLKQQIVDSELKIKDSIANEPKLTALLPPLQAKEKQLLKEYLSQLPKKPQQTQAAK